MSNPNFLWLSHYHSQVGINSEIGKIISVDGILHEIIAVDDFDAITFCVEL